VGVLLIAGLPTVGIALLYLQLCHARDACELIPLSAHYPTCRALCF